MLRVWNSPEFRPTMDIDMLYEKKGACRNGTDLSLYASIHALPSAAIILPLDEVNHPSYLGCYDR